MRRLIPLLLCAALIAGPAAAAPKEGAPGTNVEMPFLIAPITVDGKLTGYAYISSKLVATSQSAAYTIRDKLAFIQDAFVRDVNGASIGLPSDPSTVDKANLSARLVADARRIVGTDKVANLVFTEIQFSPLHPSATTEATIPPEQRAVQGVPSAASPTGSAPAPATSAPISQPQH